MIKTHKLIEIINKMKNISSTNEKIKYLSDLYKNEEYFFFKILKCTYDKTMVFGISSIDCVDEPIEDKKYVGESLFQLLDRLNSRDLTGLNAKSKVECYLGNYKNDIQEIIINILNKNLNIGVNDKTINKCMPKDSPYLIPIFEVQRADTLDFNKHFKENYFVSPKLDGIRAIGRKKDLFKLRNRSGLFAFGLEHIENEIRYLHEKYNIDYFDGELYSDDIHFNEIQSIVVSDVNFNMDDKRKIKYNLFACLSENNLKNTEDMMNLLRKISEENCKYITVVEQKLFNFTKENFEKEIKDIAKKHVDNGYEGIVLRDAEEYHNFKRSKALLKFKFFIEHDFEVIGHYEGTKRNKGKLGGISIKGYYNENYVETNVGSGFTDKERELIWNNPDSIVGKIVEIKFQGLSISRERDNKIMSLKFASFKKFKNDR